jgi:adenylate cyclase class 2
MDGDIEANEEFEFETDEGQFDRAVAFVTSLGYEVVAKKTKRGLSYSLAWGDGLGDLTIELCEVSTLGWFIEMEFVLEKRAQVEDAKRALGKALALLEIENSQIEGKPYLLLLSQITG